MTLFQKKHSIFILVVLVLGLVFMFIIRNNSKNANVENELDKHNLSELNFLFYPIKDNELSNTKIIDLYFNEAISEYSLKGVKLYQDDVLVTTRVDINEMRSSDNVIVIELLEYIPQFNRAEFMTDKDDILSLYTGQFYLDRFSYPNHDIANENRYVLTYSHGTESEKEYWAEYKFSFNKKANVQVLYPESFQKVDFKDELQLVLEKEGTVSYEYMLKIDDNYYNVNKLTDVSVEILWVQQEIDSNKKRYIFSNFISLFNAQDVE